MDTCMSRLRGYCLRGGVASILVRQGYDRGCGIEVCSGVAGFVALCTIEVYCLLGIEARLWHST